MMRLSHRIPFLLLLLFAVSPVWLRAQAATPGLSERPVLVLDPGMHTAPIIRADVDAAGRLAVTGFDDKTVRVWSLADGRLLRTIRLPQGPGNVGKAYAVAISPDGAVIAAGGWTRDSTADRRSSLPLRRRDRRDDRPDRGPAERRHPPRLLARRPAAGGGAGRRPACASTTARTAGRRSRATRTTAISSYGAAFAADGRLATTSYDGRLRLYDADGTAARGRSTPAAAEPFGLAFSPDGARLAVGYRRFAPRCGSSTAHSLAPLPAPDTSGIDNGNLATVAWSADGATLYRRRHV